MVASINVEKKTAMLMVRVDGLIDGVYVGSVASPHFKEPLPFQGLDKLVLMLDQFFDQMNFPQAVFKARHFTETEERALLPTQTVQNVPSRDSYMEACGYGTLCTFFIAVIARQNASWQGEITWIERGEKIAFRSTLELMRVMEEAAQQPKHVPRRKKAVSSPPYAPKAPNHQQASEQKSNGIKI